MADRESDIHAALHGGVGTIAARDWDRVAGSDPFLSHAFLSALEDSGSVGPGTGWTPVPVTIEVDGAIAAAAPAYLKTHSQGEYVFDHGWADAWQRAGGTYYPKLQVAVPFTPVPGARLLGDRQQHLLGALETITRDNSLSSAHITFIDHAGADQSAERGWLIRHGVQYHWLNRGYGDFADFLAALSSRKRKVIRKERMAALDGLSLDIRRGSEITTTDWDAMWAFYQDTGARKWGQPYLTRAFFDLIAERMGDALLLFLARRDGVAVAGALNMIGPDALYGRYWGASEELPFLHFELCYYQAIEWAIANGLGRVEAGAQGEHKVMRGYEPVITRSAHFIPDPSFRAAVADFVEREQKAVGGDIEWLAESLPYRESGSP
ncbi:MAG: GNAT family N-acetyltransferase [Sphingomicrobium sp.]